LGVVAAGVLALRCGKGALVAKKAKDVKKLAEKIEFKPAKTLEEATTFGKNKLGIKNYDGFAEADADVLNWAHEACANIKNATKGKVQPFDAVVFVEMPETVLAGAFNDCNTQLGRVLGINKQAKQILDKLLQNANITGVNVSSQQAQNVVKNLNRYRQAPESFTFSDRMQLYEDLKCLIHSNGTQVGNKFSTLYHEVGHFEHQLAVGSKRYLEMGKPHECIENIGKVSEATTEFLNNPQIQKTANSISKYAQESPLEFVAETYSELIHGQKLSDDVMALYRKYGGPII